MAAKTFPKSIQSAAAKALPLWQFMPEMSDGTIQSFARSLGDDSFPLKQILDFQKGSGDYFYVNYWILYSGVGKGGALFDYDVFGGERLDISLKGETFEKCAETSASLIQSTADQYAKEPIAEFDAINKLMTSIMSEYTEWRRSMRTELTDYKSYLNSRLSVDRLAESLDEEEESDSRIISRGELWEDFDAWRQKTDVALRMADYFAVTPGAEHQLVPYPDRLMDDARFGDFSEFLRHRGYLKSELQCALLRAFWPRRPRLKNDFGQDKYLGNDCFVCAEAKARGNFVEKQDPCFGAYNEFVCSKCLK